MKKIINLSFIFVCVSIVNAQDTLILYPTMDAPIGFHDNYNPGTANDGSGKHFTAYVIPGTTGGINLVRSVIYYDLSSIPIGTEIVSAKMKFYAYNNYPVSAYLSVGHRGNNEVYFKKMTSSWTEFGVSWLGRPGTIDEGQIIVPTSDSVNQDYNIEATDMFQYFVDNPDMNFGLQMGLVDETVGNAKSFHSRNSNEIEKRPSLVIVYQEANAKIKEINEFDFSISPNPSHEIVKINLSKELIDFNISVFNMTGKLSKSQNNLSGNQCTIDLSGLKKGIYFLELTSGDLRLRKKILVD